MSKTNREKLSDVLWSAGIFDHEYGDTIIQLFDQERAEVWNEAVKECEGCVPEEKTKEALDYLDGTGYKNEGHNSCRQQTLQAISKLRV